MTKIKAQITIGIVSLISLLVYTFVHTGGLLSDYVQPFPVGYIAAFGIEMSIVSLSLRIGESRRNRQSNGFFVFVLVAVVIVSAIANIAEGFRVSQDTKLTLATMKELDAVQATIGLVATGLISLIVLALSEIVGTDVYKGSDNLDSVPDKPEAMFKPLSKQERQIKLLKMDVSDKGKIARQLNVSVKTIERDLAELNGKVA